MVATPHVLSMLQPQLIQLHPQTNRKMKQNKPSSPFHMEENQDPEPNFKLCKTPITNVSETCHTHPRNRQIFNLGNRTIKNSQII